MARGGSTAALLGGATLQLLDDEPELLPPQFELLLLHPPPRSASPSWSLLCQVIAISMLATLPRLSSAI